MTAEDANVVTWVKAYALNGFGPELLAPPAVADIPRQLLLLHSERMADEKFGPGRWVRRDDVTLEEEEPYTRDLVFEEEDDDGNPVLDEDGEPVMVAYHDDNRYFRLTAWYRPKGPGE
jgi:hypothetical protein